MIGRLIHGEMEESLIYKGTDRVVGRLTEIRQINERIKAD